MMMNDLRYTGTKIGDVLAEQGRRQDWLAAQVGVKPATVNRWIRGSRQLDRANAERVASALGVPFSLLFLSPIGDTPSPEGVAA
ncbi:MAG: helix-turn-helix transcriptional regulator [Thermomicrobiales bacterium]